MIEICHGLWILTFRGRYTPLVVQNHAVASTISPSQGEEDQLLTLWYLCSREVIHFFRRGVT